MFVHFLPCLAKFHHTAPQPSSYTCFLGIKWNSFIPTGSYHWLVSCFRFGMHFLPFCLSQFIRYIEFMHHTPGSYLQLPQNRFNAQPNVLNYRKVSSIFLFFAGFVNRHKTLATYTLVHLFSAVPSLVYTYTCQIIRTKGMHTNMYHHNFN